MNKNPEAHISNFKRDPEQLVEQAIHLFDTTSREFPILVGEMALMLDKHGVEGPGDFIRKNSLPILNRATHYRNPNRQQWMMRRAEDVVEGYASLKHDQGKSTLKYLDSFASLQYGKEQAPRADAALGISVGLVDVLSGSRRDQVLAERIPTYFKNSQRYDTKQLALNQLVASGVDILAYFNAVDQDLINDYRGPDSQYSRGNQWHKDHLLSTAAKAYSTNGKWLQCKNIIDVIENPPLKGGALVDLWMGLSREEPNASNTDQFKDGIKLHIREIREKMRYPPVGSPEEYQIGWQELSIGLATMYRNNGEYTASRQLLAEVTNTEVVAAHKISAALVAQYVDSGVRKDRDIAVDFLQKNVEKPQTYLTVVTQLATADYQHGRTIDGSTLSIAHREGEIPEITEFSGQGRPEIFRNVRELINNSRIDDIHCQDLAGQLYEVCAYILASNECAPIDLNIIRALTSLEASRRPSMVGVLLASASANTGP